METEDAESPRPTGHTDQRANSIPIPQSRQSRGGYATLSRFVASDKAFCIFRRFDTLAVGNLLYMQDELCEIEQQISELDEADMSSGLYVNLYSLHSRRFDKNEKRVALIQKSAEKLRIYEKALLRRSRLLALPKPSERNVTSLSNWIDGKKPVIEEESHFLDYRADLVPLSYEEAQGNFLESFLERHCYRLFVTAKHRAKPHAVTDPANVRYYSLTTIRRVVRMLVTLAAVFAITGPTFVLYFENRAVVRLLLIVVFSLFFAIVLTIATNGKNQDIFAIVAALVYPCLFPNNLIAFSAFAPFTDFFVKICCCYGCFCWK